MFWYHEATKHSYASVRSKPNRLSWEDQPTPFKQYPESFARYRFDLDNEEEHFLFHIAGINAKKRYPGVEYYLRMNPSAGALYPNELYLQLRGVAGKPDGIYHYDVAASALTLLVVLEGEEGIELYLGYREQMRGCLFLLSSVYWRSAWKYKTRAFRYCLLDAGHILGAVEAAALLKPHATSVRYDIDKAALNRMFGFDGREWFTAAASVAVPIGGSSVTPVVFSLPYVEAAHTFEPNETIACAYAESMAVKGCKKEVRAPHFSYRKKQLQEAIFRRRSQREFAAEAITKGQFGYLMEVLSEPILSDCDEKVNVYVVVNRVLDMPPGLYKNGAYLKYGDFSREAGYLCLEQYKLAGQGALALFLTSSGENYQALYQKAGIIGHRLYIAAEYLGLGCSGIGAYYDDEVNAFLENDDMVLYALVVGR